MVTIKFVKGTGAYGLIINAYVCFAFAYTFSYCRSSITGIKAGQGFSTGNLTANIGWTTNLSVLFWAIISGCLALYELLLMFNPIKFGWLKSGLLRGIAYAVLGFLVLGCAADFGIIAASFEFLDALIIFLFYSLIKMGCVEVTEKEEKLPPAPPSKAPETKKAATEV